MSRYVLNSENSKSIKSATKKFGKFDINNDKLKGTIHIVNYRKYSAYEEVDVVFSGEVYAKVNYKNEWLTLDTIKKLGKRISKVKLNRFMRKACIFDVACRMKYFGGDIRYYNHIKKITWI
jgi:hypothetical protein